ncbi:MAG: hypothetical protein R6W70_00085 [bacterium]
MSFIEIAGYTASILVAVSLTMTNVFKLRVINSVGALVFVIYGSIVGAYPVAAVNVFIIFVNAWHLWCIARNTDEFELLIFEDTDNAYLHRFLEYYRKDLTRRFPRFKFEELPEYEAVFVLRNMLPVNLTLFRSAGNGVVEIILDYAVPNYQDFKNAYFLYGTYNKELKKKGFHTYKIKTESRALSKYLLNELNFKRDEKDPALYSRKI